MAEVFFNIRKRADKINVCLIILNDFFFDKTFSFLKLKFDHETSIWVFKEENFLKIVKNSFAFSNKNGCFRLLCLQTLSSHCVCRRYIWKYFRINSVVKKEHEKVRNTKRLQIPASMRHNIHQRINS